MGLPDSLFTMTSQAPRRERAFSDKAQAAMAPQRPGLPGRTFSAPVGGLHRLDSTRTATEGGMKSGRTVIEEEEAPTSPGEGITALRADEASSKPNLPHVTIAVIGHETAGKTTFIRSALDMKHSPTSRSTTKKMSLDGSVYIVRLLEIEARDISIASDGTVGWPRFGNETPPTIDGALVIHDVTQPASLSALTGLLDSLTESSFPFILVGSKCDVQSSDGPCEPALANYEFHRTSPDSPRSQKLCIAMVLRSVIGRKYDLIEYSPNFPSHAGNHTRALSETPTAFTGAAGGPIPDTWNSGVDGNGVDRPPTDQTTASILASTSQGSRYARSNSHPVRPHTPPTGTRLNPQRPSAETGESSPSKDRHRQHRLHTAWRNSGGSDAFNSFLEMEDELDEPRSAPSSPESKDPAPSEESSASSNETGFTFDELVDRLVAQPMSKQDSKFASIFLCLYRKFAAPSTLLNALIHRFERNERNTADQLTRIADQLRLLTVMAQWVSEYPGDLAYPKTRKRITDFVSTLEKSHFYMFAAKEVGSYLEVHAEDDDVGWAFRDGDVDTFDGQDTFFDTSGRSSPTMFLGVSIGEDASGGDEEEEDPIYNMSALDLSEGLAESTSRLGPSLGPPDRPGTVLNQSFTCLNLDAAQREAQMLEVTPRAPLTKLQWRQFMEMPDEDFARELTRIDWIMFNSFRPRDLVRHVSISGPDKDKIQSLKHVNRMIKQFNHLAFFVASVILFRDKPKHRAKALEKFMNIAQKLRRLNNYNSLGAVIAGINGTPVHRLSQTRELVPNQTQKDFMRLVILMGTGKSHFAYRLAWDNSFSERIPFLPLHRRDLVSAEEGNKTFVGDTRTRINWRKFEVMGEVVLGIQHSQKTPYPQMPRYEEAVRLVLEMKLSGDDEDLYARSMQVEPSTGPDTGRKKFGWLRS
ncbi:ras guanine nucleotide exchange factor domain-containing protein [Aspergillus ambiguus]|uniref:putative Ras guanyl-nucleotide exchange factor RasGEF n=1 Tax=Aspergillus ambiguus TaxID=176160 RepID=UPI003CCDBF3F